MSVDGTDFRIPNHGKIFASHKLNGKSGLRYEVGVSILEGLLVWLNGPFPCGEWPDINIFRNCLQSFLDEGERVEADNGYRGSGPWYVKCPANIGNPTANLEMQNRVRSRHETVNGRFKSWAILEERYRHDLSTHGYVFRAIVVLTQLSIENGEPLFKVDYKM